MARRLPTCYFRLMYRLVGSLQRSWLGVNMSQYEDDGRIDFKQTQLVLKQSWEQKNEPEMPCFKQVGHCNFAGFPQSGEMQVWPVTSANIMVNELRKSHEKMYLFKIWAREMKRLGRAFSLSWICNSRAGNAMKRIALNIALGQVLSICLTLTNTSTSLLWLYYNVNVPPLQNLLNYVMLFSVYTAVHIYKHGREAWKLMLRERAWKCKLYMIVSSIYFVC
jgi:hypothetical protein